MALSRAAAKISWWRHKLEHQRSNTDSQHDHHASLHNLQEEKKTGNERTLGNVPELPQGDRSALKESARATGRVKGE